MILSSKIQYIFWDSGNLLPSVREGKVHILKMLEGQIVNRRCPGGKLAIQKKMRKVFKPDGTYQKIAAIERHKNTGKIGVGIVKGFAVVRSHRACPTIHTI